MKTLPLGSSGLSITPIVFGGWQAGKDHWPGATDEDSKAAMVAAFEAGITTFDTAEVYGDGHSESLLGEALGAMRGQIQIATKVSWENLRAEALIEACDGSLQRLGTDWIDLYQIHWPAGSFDSEVVPIEETMGALLRLKEGGKIRAIGVSIFSADQLRDALACGPVDAIQPCWSLFWRPFEAGTRALCRERQITVLAYSPLAQGMLTGRFPPGASLAEGDNRLDNLLFRSPHVERAWAALEQMRALSPQTPLSHLALAWLHNQPGVAAIVGARTAAQARDNAAAAALQLDPNQHAALDALGAAVYAPLAEEPMMWSW